jgi:hypothetical protein
MALLQIPDLLKRFPEPLQKSEGYLTKEAAVSAPDQTFDIFLSHSYSDANAVRVLKQELERFGHSVYVDWIADGDLHRHCRNLAKGSGVSLDSMGAWSRGWYGQTRCRSSLRHAVHAPEVDRGGSLLELAAEASGGSPSETPPKIVVGQVGRRQPR